MGRPVLGWRVLRLGGAGFSVSCHSSVIRLPRDEVDIEDEYDRTPEAYGL